MKNIIATLLSQVLTCSMLILFLKYTTISTSLLGTAYMGISLLMFYLVADENTIDKIS